MKIFSFSPFGYEGSVVSVEVDLRRGIPAVDIVGLADGAVKESRERMRAAILNSGFEFPAERVLISLSPADVRKEGSGFDLAVALAVLEANRAKQSDSNFRNVSGDSCYAGASAVSESGEPLQEYSSAGIADEVGGITVKAGSSYGYSGEGDSILVMGELELSGNVRAVRGVHAASSTAKELGICRCIVPAANADEAREVSGMKVCGVSNLADAFFALSLPDLFTTHNDSAQKPFEPEGCVEIDGVLFPPVESGSDFYDVAGQKKMVRGLQIAAAGGHNVLAVGAPGCGKTMALQKFHSLLPLLTVEEAQSVTRVYSLAGILSPKEPLMRIPPFRMPHQTATIEGICGGGVHCVPGEISLAHNGVLFLDEASEFRQSVLQMLRVPLETMHITIARAGRSTTYPASFQLLMAANPCPCGNFGSKTKLCVCSTRSRELYWKKFSAPLLDRIDMRIAVENEISDFKATSFIEKENSCSTDELRKEIARAVKIQRERQTVKNSRLSPNEVAGICVPTNDAQKILDNAARRFDFSPRGMSACLKIARTVADMAGSQKIEAEHISEAVSFRKSCDFIPGEA